jgi:hypothetical protein
VRRLTRLVLVLWPAIAFAGPSGRVIRVERTASHANVAPRLCEIRGEAGTCLGEAPRVGQTMLVLDEHRVVAELQVVEAASFVATCTNLWTVKTRALHGGPTGDGVGVIDVGISPSRAHVLDKHHFPAGPSGVTGEEVWRAIDRDGDGTADIVVTRYNCDGSGRPTGGWGTYCVELWARVGGPGGKMARTSQINLAQCNL